LRHMETVLSRVNHPDCTSNGTGLPSRRWKHGSKIARKLGEEYGLEGLCGSSAAGVLLGNHRQLRELGGGNADALEALRHDAVRRGQKRDQQVHRRDIIASLSECPAVGLAQQPNDIIGKELAIEHEQGITVAVFLMEQLLKLSQELGKIGAEALAPVMHTWIGDGQQAHEDVRAAEAV